MSQPIAKAATKAVETATKAVEAVVEPITTALKGSSQPPRRSHPFAKGKKKVYLPSAMIHLIRNHPGASPYQATFTVPLRFNKLDLRDYLWHCYGVPVKNVRSFVNSLGLQAVGSGGQVSQPASKKMMIVELETPFVWPERVKGADLPAEYDYERNQRLVGGDRDHMSLRALQQKGELPMLTHVPLNQPLRGRPAMAEEARALLKGEKVWKNDTTLDPRWDGLHKADRARK